MFIDTHCHLQKEYYDNIEQIIIENKEAGVDKIIVSGCTKDEIIEVLEYAKKFPEVYLTLGFHPEVTNEITDSDLEWLEKTIINNKKVVGVGEIGLDYHYDDSNKKEQIVLFEKQLELAKKLNLPVVIHSRDANSDTIRVLKKHGVSGVIHCFGESLDMASQYIEIGYKLGIGGIVTFKNSTLRDVVKCLSLDNIVLETDSPYLAPTPYRGKTNSSKYIPIIASEIASLLNTTIEEVAIKTTSNAIEIFNIN